MNTLENVKQWFIDRDLENSGRLDMLKIFKRSCNGYCRFISGLEDFEEVSKYMSENIEIIGNVYENPELLEDKE